MAGVGVRSLCLVMGRCWLQPAQNLRSNHVSESPSTLSAPCAGPTTPCSLSIEDEFRVWRVCTHTHPGTILFVILHPPQAHGDSAATRDTIQMLSSESALTFKGMRNICFNVQRRLHRSSAAWWKRDESSELTCCLRVMASPLVHSQIRADSTILYNLVYWQERESTKGWKERESPTGHLPSQTRERVRAKAAVVLWAKHDRQRCHHKSFVSTPSVSHRGSAPPSLSPP